MERRKFNYNDWRGSVSLDNPDDDRELYRIAGVDPKVWLICGIEISGASGIAITASVLAVRRELVHDRDWNSVARDNGGAVPVTEFEFREGTALALLGEFKRFELHATLGPLIYEGDIELEIVETVYPPEN